MVIIQVMARKCIQYKAISALRLVVGSARKDELGKGPESGLGGGSRFLV
jgi:hypothetical protein